MPWPKEHVVVQQGCSRQEELGLFHVADLLQRYVHSLASESPRSIVKVLVEVQILYHKSTVKITSDN